MRTRHQFPLFVAGFAMSLPQPRAAAAEVANPYDVLPRCPDDAAARASRPLRGALTPDDTIQLALKDQYNLQVDAEGNADITGRVVVSQGVRELSADTLKISEDGRRLEVDGGVEYRDTQLVVRGASASFNGGAAAFEGARFELPYQPARGTADSLKVDESGIVKLVGVQYTTCPEDQPDWQIRADSVSIDTTRSIGTARDARVEFFGVPLLRLPVISFPVGNVRKSGFLFPSVGSSTNSGVQLSVPYYVNIAPQQDLLITPTWYTSRGVDFAGDYRYLTQSSHGEILGNLLPGDSKTNDARSRVRLRNLTELPAGWQLSIDAENVSDPQYYEDFAQGSADGASIAFLPRRVSLGYRGEHLDAGVMLRNFQTLDQELPQADRPHTEVPRLYASGNWQLPGALALDYGVDAEASLFQHSDDVQGWRFDAAPRIGLDYTGAGYFFRPSAVLETTQYRLRDNAPGADDSPSRTLPRFSVDSGLLFERSSGKRDQRRITLEPRLMYLYVPYRNQDALPIFDTGEPDLNWIELFRTNRYVGLDRVSDANQISAGLTTQLYSSVDGTRFLSTTIGQAYHFDRPKVRLPDEAEEAGSTSDLIAQVELQAFRNWSVSTGLQWNPHEERTERAEMRLQYRPEARSVLNLGYRFQQGRLEQAEFSAAWPVTQHWRLYGRSVYSLRDEQSIEQFAGFEYSSCCWNLRAVARDFVSRRSGERDRSIYLQLELKGLSNVGLAADAFLEKAIRGYSTRRRD
ncbi:MAG: LPS assembly protein LptD [Steroidobacteraceae bacterium]